MRLHPLWEEELPIKRVKIILTERGSRRLKAAAGRGSGEYPLSPKGKHWQVFHSSTTMWAEEKLFNKIFKKGVTKCYANL